MKMLRRLLFSFVLIVGPLFAAGHSAALSWTAPSDATSGTTYTIYRAAEACPAAPDTNFSLLTSGVTTTSYTDSTVTVGTWCYYVEQVQNSTSSAPSNLAGGTAAPNPVAALTVVVK